MALKRTNIQQHCKTLQNLPKLGFLFGNYAIRQPRHGRVVTSAISFTLRLCFSPQLHVHTYAIQR
jgi:hypothetical protein